MPTYPPTLKAPNELWFWLHNIELSCAAESPARSEPQRRHSYEKEDHLRRQLQRFVRSSSYDDARIRLRDSALPQLPLSGSLSNSGEHDPSERTCRCLRIRKAHVLPCPCRRRSLAIAFGQRTCLQSVQIDAIHVVSHQRPQ